MLRCSVSVGKVAMLKLSNSQRRPKLPERHQRRALVERFAMEVAGLAIFVAMIGYVAFNLRLL